MPENTVKVDRTTAWGNPFVVGKHGESSARCAHLFKMLLGGYIAISLRNVHEQQATYEHARAHIGELRGKNLACWCRLEAPCHADALLEAANRDAP